MLKTLVVFLLFNLTFFTIHPDLNRQYGDFSQHVKNAIFALKAPYQVKTILGGSIPKPQPSFTTKPKPICGGSSQHKMAAKML